MEKSFPAPVLLSKNALARVIDFERELTFEIHKNKIFKIGRNKQLNDLVLNDLSVSAIHCLIWVVQFDEAIKPVSYLKDVSLNGVFINNELVGKNNIGRLNDNDIITIENSARLHFNYLFEESVDYIKHEIQFPQRWDKMDWFVTDKMIGYGSFGRVYIAGTSNNPKKLYAVKVLSKPSAERSANNEVNILKNLCHPNIISIHDTVFETYINVYYIFQDLVCGGDLHSYLTQDGYFSELKEPECKMIIYQLLLAVQYLHSEGVIHRDLKLDNVLLEYPEPYTRVFISDFGAAKNLKVQSRTFTVIGTPEYCAPEVGFNYSSTANGVGGDGREIAMPGYGKPCDMWSLGVILYIMLTAYSPFYRAGDSWRTSLATKEGNLHLEDAKIWKGVGQDAKQFVSSLLNTNHYKRITVNECFDHRWIKKHEVMLQSAYDLILESSNV